MTRLRASLVKGEKLAEIGREIGLADQVILGRGELKSGGWRRASILANTLEAIIGAVYLDAGLNACRDFIGAVYRSHLEKADPGGILKDSKSRLQEYLQARQEAVPVYETIAETGAAHQPEFTVACKVRPLTEAVTATGQSKRGAEQAAAEKTLALLRPAHQDQPA